MVNWLARPRFSASASSPIARSAYVAFPARCRFHPFAAARSALVAGPDIDQVGTGHDGAGHPCPVRDPAADDDESVEELPHGGDEGEGRQVSGVTARAGADADESVDD